MRKERISKLKIDQQKVFNLNIKYKTQKKCTESKVYIGQCKIAIEGGNKEFIAGKIIELADHFPDFMKDIN